MISLVNIPVLTWYLAWEQDSKSAPSCAAVMLQSHNI